MRCAIWVLTASLGSALAACSSSEDGGSGSASGGAPGGGPGTEGGARAGTGATAGGGGVSSGGTSAGGGTGGASGNDGGAAGAGGAGGIGGVASGGSSTGGSAATALGCPSPLPSDWIFCEDFETGNAPGDVFMEYDDNAGDFRVVDTEGNSGSHSLEAVYQAGEVGAGYVNVSFGDNPAAYGSTGRYREGETFEDIYWRLFIKHQSGWPDIGPAKVTRATAFANSNWGQAMIAHVWSAGDDVVLLGDPATCVSGGTVPCNTYNDFPNLSWLGQMRGTTEVFSSADSGNWRCLEAHVTLNTPGQSDGVFEFWVDDHLENSRTDLDWRGTWTDYGINFVSIENYWNSGAVSELRRWIDDIAIATTRIGCE